MCDTPIKAPKVRHKVIKVICTHTHTVTRTQKPLGTRAAAAHPISRKNPQQQNDTIPSNKSAQKRGVYNKKTPPK
jgi:hypothetical protein